MWLYRESGYERLERNNARAIKLALEEARNRDIISLGDRQLIQGESAKYLCANNSIARRRWTRAICREVSDHFDLGPDHSHPDMPIYLITLVDAACSTPHDVPSVDIERFKKILRCGLRGLSYIGMIEPALYTNRVAGPLGLKAKLVSWHFHAIAWGLSPRAMKQYFKRLRASGLYRPLAEGLRGAHHVRIEIGELGPSLGYVCKSPSNSYRQHKSDFITKDGEIRCRFRQWKGDARKGERVVLFRLMRDLYLDRLAMAGGEGVALLRRAKQKALVLLKPIRPAIARLPRGVGTPRAFWGFARPNGAFRKKQKR